MQRVLDALARLEPVSIRMLARAVDLPVPIVAAICGELRQDGVVSETRPAQLTIAGRKAVCGRGSQRRGGLSRVWRARHRLARRSGATPARARPDRRSRTGAARRARPVSLHGADEAPARPRDARRRRARRSAHPASRRRRSDLARARTVRARARIARHDPRARNRRRRRAAARVHRGRARRHGLPDAPDSPRPARPAAGFARRRASTRS